jgi:voltage-gated potassium channel
MGAAPSDGDSGARTAVMEKESDRTRRERWEEHTRTPLLFFAAAFLIAYSWLILEPLMASWLRILLFAVLAFVWASFILDVVVRLSLTPRRSRLEFARRHRIEFLSAIIPILRPFRLLRHLRSIPGFRGNGGDSLRSRLVVTTLLYEAMFVYVISLGVLASERGAPHATIVSFGDTIWWACVTVATVGYGDFYPVTVLGRFLAVLLMAGGVVIIGTASATIISSLNDRVQHARRHTDDAERAREGEQAVSGDGGAAADHSIE